MPEKKPYRERPKVSVIVPVYNHERFIGRCMRSLLQQTMDKNSYEIILVDDASTDLTPYAIEQFSSRFASHIVTIRNEENLGLPASLNKALAVAVGEFIVRVDSDDFVNENFLTFLYQYLVMNPQADAVACDYLLTNDLEEVIGRGDCQKEPIGCAILFRKQHILNVGLYNEEFRNLEEKELRARFDKHYTVEHLTVPLYRYRRHDHNITNNKASIEHYRRKLEEIEGQNERQTY